jgi:hypothetical protein
MKLKTYRLNHKNGQQEKGWVFWCPACRQEHRFCTKAVSGVREDGTRWPVWTFNGDMARPTFSPSLLYQTGKGRWEGTRWVATGPKRVVCHLHLRDGQLAYCGDNPHQFNGKTVPLPDLPEPVAG